MVNISPSQVQQLEKLLRARAQFLFDACPGCHQIVWNIPERVLSYVEFNPEAPPPQVYPIILVVCRNCGYTHSVSAVFLGIIDQGTGKLNIV